MVMVEPMAFSPTLQWIRDKLPIKKKASPAERQLNAEECRFISGCLYNARVRHYDLFSRLTRLFRWKAAYLFFGAIDAALIAVFPFLKKFYGEIVIVGDKPSIP